MRRPAFTFLEVLIALSLFAVGMISIVQIFPINRRYLTQSALTTQAVFLAQEGMEQARSDSYADLVVGASPAYEPEHALSSTAGDPMSQFQRQTVATYVDPTTSNASPAVTYSNSGTDKGMKRIDVTVFWQENNISRQYTISTYVHN